MAMTKDEIVRFIILSQAALLGSNQPTVIDETFAPVLTWDGDSTDNSPDFTAVFDFRATEGDEVTLQFASDENFTADLATYTKNLTSVEIAGDLLAFTVTTLADGTWYARIKHKLTGGPYSDWSNTELLTVQTSVDSVFIMEDGTSSYLLEDGVSKYLLE